MRYIRSRFAGEAKAIVYLLEVSNKVRLNFLSLISINSISYSKDSRDDSCGVLKV